MNRRIAALAIAATAIFGLSACSAPSGGTSGNGDSGTDAAPSTQTVAEACAQVNDTIESAVGNFDDVDANDPAAAVDAFRTASDAIADAANEVGNAEVKELLPSLSEAFTTIADALETMAEGDLSKMSEFEEATTKMQEDVAAFQELCA